MKFGELMKRLEDSGIGSDAEVLCVSIEHAPTPWSPGPCPAPSEPDRLTIMVKA